MAGIYIHIPFCKQACHYCNFHFSTSLGMKEKVLSAIHKEIEIQKNYLQGEEVETIYFGGGTPSILNVLEIENILNSISKHHSIISFPEITIEANPDDLTTKKLKELNNSEINRLSIGVQSFFDEDLQFMNRAHNSNEAFTCISEAQQLGFQNISIDLIYGSPTTTHQMWEANLDKTFSFQIPHISSYCLTVEPNTALDHFVKKGLAKPVDDEKSSQQFKALIERTHEKDYEHYEISNFALKNKYSKHNTSYWQGKKYLGLGPGAHSFNGHQRQWNIANNATYSKLLNEQNILKCETEDLSPANKYNEYVMTALRTQWGINTNKIDVAFIDYFYNKINPFIEEKYLNKKEQSYTLSPSGKLIADRIAMELFWVD